jgi:hypothetical protein
MSDSSKTEHIKGFYLIIVAFISLIGGYLLKDPIKNAFTKKYAQIAGVWKPHGDLVLHCAISTIKDTFYIRIDGTYTSMDDYIIQGHGVTNGTSGDFLGTLTVKSKTGDTTTPIWGYVEIAGSDQLGVTIFFNQQRIGEPRVYAFIRETQNSVETNDDSKKNQ